MKTNNNLYPLFLNLERVQTLIIGGKSIALEKLTFILKSSPNARILLIAEFISEEVKEIAKGHSNLILKTRSFHLEDLKDNGIVIAATSDNDLNALISQNARRLNVLVNVADQPAISDFYLGSIVTRGDLKIAISTNGKSPTLAKRFREILEETIPDTTSETLLQLNKIRRRLTGDFKFKLQALNQLTSILSTKEKSFLNN